MLSGFNFVSINLFPVHCDGRTGKLTFRGNLKIHLCLQEVTEATESRLRCECRKSSTIRILSN
jgi:hypothetical protein